MRVPHKSRELLLEVSTGGKHLNPDHGRPIRRRRRYERRAGWSRRRPGPLALIAQTRLV